MQIVYNAFNGRYADNPRAIYEGLRARRFGDRHIWLTDARFADAFPASVETVPIGTYAATAALENADLVVANNHIQLDRWAKPAGATYLQTWHGTPLKRIHRSAITIPAELTMAELDADIERWDYLLAPSPEGTELLRGAFSYGGTVLETGYPRNDVLNHPDREQRRQQVRDALGVAADATAILYAPTWRDDQLHDEDAPPGLDAAALLAKLPADHVLLVRPHYYLTHRPPRVGERLVDASRYPEIADLYLAADVLITDYSSAVFDFTLTGKPILLYVYDLEHYRSRLRGLTLDLEAEAPGPLVCDQPALLRALLDLPGSVAAHAERYAAFRRRYADPEDGRATDRVLAAVFGL